MFKKIRTMFYVGKVVNSAVHQKYGLKIMQGLGGNADGNSDHEAKREVCNMILNGDINRNDIASICEIYMGIRDNIIVKNGGMPRWVEK